MTKALIGFYLGTGLFLLSLLIRYERPWSWLAGEIRAAPWKIVVAVLSVAVVVALWPIWVWRIVSHPYD